MAELIAELRAPYRPQLDRVLARTDSLLYRRGNFNGTFDDVICQALLTERDAQIALSPGFRWGSSLPPGHDIRLEDVYNQTADHVPRRIPDDMDGADAENIFEDVADNLFTPPLLPAKAATWCGVGGMSYAIDVRSRSVAASRTFGWQTTHRSNRQKVVRGRGLGGR